MRLLFISPKFNAYEELISRELYSMDIKVDYFADKPQNLIYRIICFLSSSAKEYLDRAYLGKIIKFTKNYEYSHVLIIKGTILNEEFMVALRKIMPKAQFIMYQWDSTLTHNSYLKIIDFFDKVFTFDRKDSNLYKLEYLPLFYSGHYENLKKKQDSKFDLVFVGEFYPDSDRLEIIKKVANYMEELGLNFYYSLRVEIFALFKFLLFRHLRFKDLAYISIGRIPQEKVMELYANTIAVLDIEHIKQNGLTIRTMEVLGAGLKLITTNKNIIYEDFFSEKSIMVIDRQNIEMNTRFFDHDQTLPINKKYSSKLWLSHILQF